VARQRSSRKRSAYERRIESYLRRHPGATRQQARGHRPRGGRSEYAVRVERYRRSHPGASRAEAAGHARSGFLAYIRPGDEVMLVEPVGMIPVDGRGRVGPFSKRVVPEQAGRPVREFRIPRLSRAALAALVEAELERGALLTPARSLDQRSLL
jgi:hypothetical protein